jgi:hypothetical protein
VGITVDVTVVVIAWVLDDVGVAVAVTVRVACVVGLLL